MQRDATTVCAIIVDKNHDCTLTFALSRKMMKINFFVSLCLTPKPFDDKYAAAAALLVQLVKTLSL